MDPIQQSDVQRGDFIPCWACSTPIVVPTSNGLPAPVYAVLASPVRRIWIPALTHSAVPHFIRIKPNASIIPHASQMMWIACSHPSHRVVVIAVRVVRSADAQWW